MYYVRNNHPAIIDRATFNRTQAELARRTSKRSASTKGSVTGQGRHSRYAISDIIHCAECGSRYRRQIWCQNGEKTPVWRCVNRLENGKKYCKQSPTVRETDLHAAIVRAMAEFSGNSQDEFQTILTSVIAEAVGMNEDSEDADLLVRRIGMLNQEMMTLVDQTISFEKTMEENEEKFKVLSEEIEQLTEHLEAIRESGATTSQRQERTDALEKAVEQLRNCGVEYNDNAVRQMMECIKVYPDGRLDIIFNGGHTIREHI